MTVHLSIVLFLPLAFGVLGLLAPSKLAGRVALLGTALTLAYAVLLVVDFESGAAGQQYVTDETWIAELGISYKLGIDGLNLLLVALTAILWFSCTLWATTGRIGSNRASSTSTSCSPRPPCSARCSRRTSRCSSSSSTSCSSPFFFLTGQWGEGRRVQATMKLVIYTLVGSLLMLTAAIATGVLAASGSQELSFAFSDLAQRPLSESSQNWIFLFFAAAFLVKMPAFPLHGWMPDGYRSMPLPVLAVFSGVLSKVAAYGFLKVCLPLFPDAAENFQMLLLLIALASILYGSAMAFTTTEVRLILGYSSVAQLGFITLGIFALNDQGSQGALLQAFNHGLVVAPAFFIVALLAARAGGSQDLRDMGGIGMRAPVLATMFLIVAFATLAMPGSSNFVGEFYIVLGVFTEKIVIAIVATVGIVLASVYALRLFIGAVHNRTGPRVESREISLREGLVLVPLVLLILAIALYPQFALERSEQTVTSLSSPSPTAAAAAAAEALPGGTPYAPLEETP